MNRYKHEFCHQIETHEILSEDEQAILKQLLSYFPHPANDWPDKFPLLNPHNFPKKLLSIAANAYAGSISLLSVAAEYGVSELVQLLIKVGAKSNKFDRGPNPSEYSYNKLPLHWAINNRFSCEDKNSLDAVKVVQCLLDNGARSNIICYLGKTPLEYAKEREFNAAVHLIETHKLKISAYNRGATAGLLLDSFPPDISGQISLFFNRKDGVRIARTCKNAYQHAKIEEITIEEIIKHKKLTF
jgi:hypothetical protein